MRIVEHATKISLTSSTNRSKINEQRGMSPVCFFLVHVRHEQDGNFNISHLKN